MPVTRPEVQEELRNAGFDTLFADENRDFLLDCIDVGYFLGNGPATMDASLRVLERQLQQRLSTVELTFAEKFKFRMSRQTHEQVVIPRAQAYFRDWRARRGAPKEASPFAHLLTDELGRLEQTNGFTLLPGGKVKVYYGVLPADVFLRENKETMHWKDLINPRHGEFTHRIQWYLVMSEIRSRLGISALFGSINGVAGLWDYLFDRLTFDAGGALAATDANDFRSPEHFNDYLTGGAALAQYPLLSSFLTARRDKRESSYQPNDYLARKLFGQPFEELGDEQQLAVMQAMRDMGGVYRR